MILLIRGHIRNSFESNNLYNFVKKIYDITPDLQIFIHTWNIFANNVSWRTIEANNKIVTEDIIYNYFGNLKHLVQHIIIDDDSKIQLIGKLDGNINHSPMPLIGWKNYWYSKCKIINYIYDKNIDENEMIVNFRFDLNDNSNNFDENEMIEFVTKNNGMKFTKNKFMFDSEENGIDNIYIGNVNTMHKLCNYFFNELDDILTKNADVYHQERLVYRMNNNIFD